LLFGLLRCVVLVSFFYRFSFFACLQTAEICTFPSRYFYKDKLKTPQDHREDHRLTVWPNVRFPMVFCHVEGTEVTQAVATPEGSEQSKRNAQECSEVVRIFIRLWSLCNIADKYAK